MHIIWFGLSSFKIISKDVTIFTDPFGKAAGLTPPRGAAQIVISSNADNELANNFSSISGDPFLITGPGEYDIKSIFIKGIPSKTKTENDKENALAHSAIYSMSIEGINVGFLGGFFGKALSDFQEEELNDIDVLLVPVGGGAVCDAEAATSVINQIEPKIVIPMHYKSPGLALKLDPLEKFLKEMGGKGEEMDKLIVKKNDLEEEKTKLIILAPQRI